MKKALITGATGFIGGALLKENLARGNEVRAFHLPDDPEIGVLDQPGVEKFAGDITDLDSVVQAAKGVDVIFHCAAIVSDWAPESLFQKVMVGGAENVCKAALEAGVSRLVDISTNDVFGTSEEVVMDETFSLSPWGEPYPDYKIKAEELVWKYYQEHGLPATMVYPCWVYGEGDKTFVPLLADAIINREMLFWRKDALVWPTYIENLTDLLMLIAEDERAVGNGYLVHDGESDTLRNFSKKIALALEVKPPALRIPYPAAYGAAVVMERVWKLLKKTDRPLLTTYTVKNLGSRLRFSIEKAKQDLGWTPKISYNEGFEKTMAWLKTLDLESLKQK
ncbi:NAD-dependent epimerase/dehydratase [Desulfatibacillum aliphaticivorans]|uniref:NAD-dependent epimerase/dehydratase n=1 Tax=Desulfatibacillum aliphaticivorans TaxID=218208 RepID=B8FG53_DESAL|nr:NAD-dependent epimerase/dehydratase family protein [Desulfatibacillum aliphaticivorans]ACL03733.1 NAD-dependent epimerase/dehydratase [Desulfatibacillum aliphaticivorans]